MTTVPWADNPWKQEGMTVYEKLRSLDDLQFRLMYSGREKSRLKGGKPIVLFMDLSGLL